jgi:hypothetical protein
MELAELLDREGLDAEDVLGWARARAQALVVELAGDEGDPLLSLLEGGGSVDVVTAAAAGLEVVDLPAAVAPAQFDDPDDDVVPVAHEHQPSGSQPISADDLPPPPESPQLVAGEPEPILETFNTGPIDLGTPQAAALIAATSTRPHVEEPEAEEPEAEELEFDELVELDDEELELLDEVEDEDDPSSPPPPPQGDPSALEAEASEAVPVQTGDTAVHSVIEAEASEAGDEPEDVDLDAPAGDEDEDESFDLDFDD